MKLITKLFIPSLFLFLISFNLIAMPVHILHGNLEKQEASWVKTLLVRFGIPLDYIETNIHHHSCSVPHNLAREILLLLCIDEDKKLKILKFRKKEFFWQLGPLLQET
jgi:hypothetical protein